MSIKSISSRHVPDPPPQTWSNCLVADGIAYVAGATAPNAGADEYAQAKGTLSKIKHLVEAAGGSMADIVKVVIYVTDIKNREGVWRARREFFTGNFPVSTLVQIAALATPETKVEIDAIAHIGASRR
jgi:enamine deaminase RidA (YjgF/YER057c/UK114 family)